MTLKIFCPNFNRVISLVKKTSETSDSYGLTLVTVVVNDFFRVYFRYGQVGKYG